MSHLHEHLQEVFSPLTALPLLSVKWVWWITAVLCTAQRQPVQSRGGVSHSIRLSLPACKLAVRDMGSLCRMKMLEERSSFEQLVRRRQGSPPDAKELAEHCGISPMYVVRSKAGSVSQAAGSSGAEPAVGAL